MANPSEESKNKAEEIVYQSFPNDRQAEFLIHHVSLAIDQAKAEERERCVKRVEEEINKHHAYMTKDELFACIRAKLPIKDLK